MCGINYTPSKWYNYKLTFVTYRNSLFTHSKGERERMTERYILPVWLPVAPVSAKSPHRFGMPWWLFDTCDRWTAFRYHCRSSSCRCLCAHQCVTERAGSLEPSVLWPPQNNNNNFLSGQPQVESSSVKSGPSGYYYQGVWQPLGGTTVRQFKPISQCLHGKVVHMYGDSTIRQWFEYLKAALPGSWSTGISGRSLYLFTPQVNLFSL